MEEPAVRRALRFLPLALALLLLAWGFLRGEASELYRKAVSICLSCMGLG